MSSWAKKVEENWFIEILQAKGFIQEKKLSKNLYIFSYPLESLMISCLVYIQLDKNLSLPKFKQLLVDIFPYFKLTPNRLLILPSSPMPETVNFAQEIDLGIIDVSGLLISLFPTTHYNQYLSRTFKQKSYMIPWIYQNNTKVELPYFIKKIKETKEGSLIIVEGEKGIGKTTFNHYLSLSFGDSLSEKQTENWIIPFYISLQLFNGEIPINKYIEYQIFNPDMLSAFSKESFSLLLKHNRIVLIIDSIERISQKSFLLLEEILTCLREYISQGAKVILTTPVDFFFYQFQKKVGLKHYFQTLLSSESIARYQLRPLTLFQIKQENKQPKIQRAIEYNQVIKNLARYPAVLQLIKNLTLEEIQAITTVDNFFRNILNSWKDTYLSSLGKETLLEFIANYSLENQFFFVEETPSYIENFLLVEFRDAPLNLELLKQELEQCPFLTYYEGGFYFNHPIYHFYFIKTQLLLEVNRGNLKNIYSLQHTFLLELLTSQEIQDIILPNIEKYLETLSFKEKGTLFQLWVRIQGFSLATKDNKIFIKPINLANLSLAYDYFGALIFIGNHLSHLQTHYVDFQYSEWKETDLSYSYFRYTNISYSSFTQNNILEVDWKYLKAQQTHFTKQDFVKIDLEFSHFLQSHFHSCKFIDSYLEGTVFDTCDFISVEFQESFLSFSQYKKSTFIACIWNEIQDTHIYFMESTIKDSFWQDINIKESHFQQTHWANTKIHNIEFHNTSFAFGLFENCELENVTFSNCDLRGLSLTACKLKNIILDNCDTREMISDKNNILCSKTKQFLLSI